MKIALFSSSLNCCLIIPISWSASVLCLFQQDCSSPLVTPRVPFFENGFFTCFLSFWVWMKCCLAPLNLFIFIFNLVEMSKVLFRWKRVVRFAWGTYLAPWVFFTFLWSLQSSSDFNCWWHFLNLITWDVNMYTSKNFACCFYRLIQSIKFPGTSDLKWLR